MANNATKAATLLLALAVKDAAQIHEGSYDSRCYRKTLQDASEEAAIKHGMDGSGRLIYLALDGWWNDALEWAEEMSKIPGSKA